MVMYKHVIWDFDGTLFDTYPVMTDAFCKALKDYGIEEDYEKVYSLMKVSVSRVIEYYRTHHTIGQQFIDSFQKYRKELEGISIQPYPYIKDICAKIVENGGYNYLYTHRGQTKLRF